jgi:hypothetical protein
MKISLVFAFIVFVISLGTTVVIALQMIWRDDRLPPSPEYWRMLGTSVVIMLAALFYIPVGEAMNRILSSSQKSSSDERR